MLKHDTITHHESPYMTNCLFLTQNVPIWGPKSQVTSYTPNFLAFFVHFGMNYDISCFITYYDILGVSLQDNLLFFDLKCA